MHNLPEVAALKSQIDSVQGVAGATPQTDQTSDASASQLSTANPAASNIQFDPLPPTKIPGASLHPDSPVNADDGDLIESEWVHKAKAIVDRTRDNPYLQSQEIYKFKADYINKRYQREIKLDEV